MIISDIQEARSTLEWVEEHLEATGGKNKDVYIKGLDMVDDLLKEIQKLLTKVD